MTQPTYFTYTTPSGSFTVGVEGEWVTAVVLGDATLQGVYRPSVTSHACANQLLEYFAGKRRSFNVATRVCGTDFEKSVWRAVENIPYAQTRTIREIASLIGKPQSYRMVGRAIRNNPLAIIIPAHRVVNAHGIPPGTDRSARIRAAMLDFERQQEK